MAVVAGTAVAALAWNHQIVVGSCPDQDLPQAEPVTCVQQWQLGYDVTWVLGLAAVGFLVCLAVP